MLYRIDHFNQYTRISRKGEVHSKNVSDKSFMASRGKMMILSI